MNRREELDIFFSKYGSFFSCIYLRTSISQTPRRNLLLDEKHRLYQAYQDETSSVSKKAAYIKIVQNRLRDIQDSWLSKKAEKIQFFADRKDMKMLHDALKTVYCPKSFGAIPQLSADESTLLTVKDAILERWAEHFNKVHYRSSTVNDNAINRLPQIECNLLLDDFPTVTETREAIQYLSSDKASGTDAIPAEVYKADGLPYRVVSLHVNERGYPTIIQECIHNPYLQTKRKSLSL